MLYDVLPPIALFSSLGGIIITVSRITLRVRRQQFPDSPPPRPQDIAVDEDQIFKPEKKGINIFKNRLAYVPHLFRETVTHSSSFIKDKKSALSQARLHRRVQRQQEDETSDVSESDDYPATSVSVASSKTSPEVDALNQEQNIVMPRSAWREKIGAMASVKGLGSSLLTKAQKVRPKRSSLPIDDAATHEDDVSESTENTVQSEEVLSEAIPASDLKPAHRIVLRRTKTSEASTTVKTSKGGVISRLRNATPKPTGKSILDQASEAIASAKYNRAEDILLPYIIKHARDAQAYMLLGQTALGQRDWSEAIEIFQQVLKISPSEPGAHAALGYAALKAGRFTLALQTLQRAHEQDPQDLEVLKQLLRIAQRMDNGVLKRSVSEKITALHSSGQYH